MSNVTERPRSSPPLPLAEIPLSQERLPRLNGDLLNTAGHELNHALLARELGVSVALVSVLPEGHSLGRTIFFGRVAPETFKIIAAGGAIDTPHGSAKGYGGDIRQIQAIDEVFGSNSANLLSNARALLTANYSDAVREKAAEIIAYLGEVRGTALFDILTRAEFEVRMENSKDPLWKRQIFYDDKRQEPQPKPEEASTYTIIEHLDNGMFHIRYSENNLIDREYMFCGECGEIDGHTSTCSRNEKPQALPENVLSKPVYEHPLKNTVIARIPKKGRVYDNN